MKTDSHTISQREAHFASALKTDGMRLTHQRLEIIRELACAEDHPDADTVFRRVQRRVPTLSPDTVYRTISVLVDKRLIERISMPRATRYDPDQRIHHHFVCDRCGRLADVPEELLPSPRVPESLNGIGDIQSAHLELRGVCSICAHAAD